MGRIVFAATLLGYALVPVAALLLLRSTDRELSLILRDAGIATIPMIALALITWRLVWPRWKLVAKVVVHPFLYAILSIFLGAWSILIAWIHQGVLGLGGHIWFSRRHGFTWYAVEDPDRYVALSKAMVSRLNGTPPAPPASET